MYSYFRLLVPVLAVAIIVFTARELFDIFQIDFPVTSFYYIMLIVVSVVLAATIFLVNFGLKQYSLPRSYYVATVGFPKSGKTTLITSLFGEAFKGRLPTKFTPRGEQTIEYINKSLSLLELGLSVGPTESQDRFSFRADITTPSFPPLLYRTEFGDFPGDDSQQFANDYGTWLHNSEFFKWVIDSDSIIFIIDIAKYLSPSKTMQKYVSTMKSSIRAAWQHYMDVNEHQRKAIKKHPIVLAFTKSDLFGIDPNSTSISQYETIIAKLGYGTKTPDLAEIDHKKLDSGKLKALSDFSDLIEFGIIKGDHFKEKRQ